MAEQKTKTQLQELNDKNLLAYYKAERERTLRLLHNTDPRMYTEKQQDAKDYLTEVKRELDTRGHVETK